VKYTTAATKNKAIIDGVEITSDTLTGRGDLNLFPTPFGEVDLGGTVPCCRG
jgi:hypothetical protein